MHGRRVPPTATPHAGAAEPVRALLPPLPATSTPGWLCCWRCLPAAGARTDRSAGRPPRALPLPRPTAQRPPSSAGRHGCQGSPRYRATPDRRAPRRSWSGRVRAGADGGPDGTRPHQPHHARTGRGWAWRACPVWCEDCPVRADVGRFARAPPAAAAHQCAAARGHASVTRRRPTAGSWLVVAAATPLRPARAGGADRRRLAGHRSGPAPRSPALTRSATMSHLRPPRTFPAKSALPVGSLGLNQANGPCACGAPCCMKIGGGPWRLSAGR